MSEPDDTDEARAARAAALREQIQGRASRPRSPRDLADEEARRAAEQDRGTKEEEDPSSGAQ